MNFSTSVSRNSISDFHKNFLLHDVGLFWSADISAAHATVILGYEILGKCTLEL